MDRFAPCRLFIIVSVIVSQVVPRYRWFIALLLFLTTYFIKLTLLRSYRWNTRIITLSVATYGAAIRRGTDYDHTIKYMMITRTHRYVATETPV